MAEPGVIELSVRISELEDVVKKMAGGRDNTELIASLKAEIERLNNVITQLQAQQNELANTPTMRKALSQSRIIKKLRGESND